MDRTLGIICASLGTLVACGGGGANSGGPGGGAGSSATTAAGPGAGGGEPTGPCGTDPFEEVDVAYLGAFVAPPVTQPTTFSYGGAAIAFDPAGDAGKGSIWLTGHVYDPSLAGELTLPAPRKGATFGELPEATLLGDFVEVTGGLLDQIDNPRLEGMLLSDRGLLFNGFKYYNVDNADPAYLGLTQLGKQALDPAGLWRIGELNVQKTGYLAELPSGCRAAFGGRRFAVGSVNKAGETTTSPGPHFSAFDVDDPAARADAHLASETYLDFDVDNRFEFTVPGAADAGLGTSEGPHAWNNSDSAKGMMFAVSADGKKSAVVFVTNLSTQEPHYAYGLPEEYPNSCSTAKGTHYWGMHPTLLFFDPTELASVGKNAPHAPKPYLQVDLSAYFFDDSPSRCASIGGVAADLATGRLFVVEQIWTGSDLVPAVHVLQIR
jgi:hypothetical protein